MNCASVRQVAQRDWGEGAGGEQRLRVLKGDGTFVWGNCEPRV